MDLMDGKIGSVGKYELDFTSGHLVAVLDADLGIGSVGVSAKLDGDAVIDAICKAIPGTIDDALGGVLKSALKALSAPTV